MAWNMVMLTAGSLLVLPAVGHSCQLEPWFVVMMMGRTGLSLGAWRLASGPAVGFLYGSSQCWITPTLVAGQPLSMTPCVCGLHLVAGRRGVMPLRVDWQRKDRLGQTPLIVAAAEGLFMCVVKLLKYSPDVQVLMSSSNGCTALYMAVSAGHDDCARQLLKHGDAAAQVAAADNHGHAPLMAAAANGHVACVELLLQHGNAAAQVALTSNQGRTALMCAALNGRKACMQLLLQHCNAGQQVAANTRYGYSALTFAVQNGYDSCMRLLLQRGSAATQATAAGDTLLMLAAKHGHSACMQLLLQHEDVAAQTAAANMLGETALMFASAGGHESCTRLLLQHGDAADQLAAVRVNGLTPLLCTLRQLDAAEQDKNKAARLQQCAVLLLARGASLGPAATKQDHAALLSMPMLQDRMALAMVPDMCSLLLEQLTGQGGRGAGVAKWGPAPLAVLLAAASAGIGEGALLLLALRAMVACKAGSTSAAQHRRCVEALLMKGAVMDKEATKADHAALLSVIQRRLSLAQDPSWCNEAVVSLVVAIRPLQAEQPAD